MYRFVDSDKRDYSYRICYYVIIILGEYLALFSKMLLSIKVVHVDI
jgi:hypothetical protein